AARPAPPTLCFAGATRCGFSCLAVGATAIHASGIARSSWMIFGTARSRRTPRAGSTAYRDAKSTRGGHRYRRDHLVGRHSLDLYEYMDYGRRQEADELVARFPEVGTRADVIPAQRSSIMTTDRFGN